MDLFVKALAIGLAIAAVVGPMSLLLIERTLRRGFLAGVLTGLGIAAADGIYAALVGLGASSLAAHPLAESGVLRLAGGLSIAALGVKSLLTASGRPGEAPGRRPGGGLFLSALLLTLANPMTILSFAAIYAGLGLAASAAGAGAVLQVTGGIFLGSLAWWVALSAITAELARRLPAGFIAWTSRLAGLALLLFGLSQALATF